MMKNPYSTANTASRRDLASLAGWLQTEELAQPLEAGWTVAGVLAHLAFWDQRAFTLLQKWQEEGIGPSPIDVDVVNEVTRPLCVHLEPHTAVQLAVITAEAVDQAIAHLAPDFIAKVETDGKTVRLNRALHRREHLEQIRQALGVK
ncbi:MAG: hypothetical protein ACOYYS_11595 [Chloroflexota bacterium]